MRKTVRVLSDGREIAYFDRDDAPPRVAVDRRGLSDRPALGELRYDAFTGEWIAVAGHRQTRTFLPSAAECPLCPSTEDRHSEIPESQYDVVVFENRYPSLRYPDGDWTRPTPAWGVSAPAAGRCEVVCYSDQHDGRLHDMPTERARLVIDAWADRTASMAALPYIRQVFPFENRGDEIGVTLHHPHGQIYGYSYLPPRMTRLLALGNEYRQQTKRALIADVVAKEMNDGRRVVFESDRWVGFMPIAARWPYEVQVHPKRPAHDFTELSDEDKDDLAVVYPRLLRTFDGLFGLPMPYVSAWIQAPFNGPSGERDDITMHLQLHSPRRAPGKVKFPAGSELAMWAYVADVPAEQSAAELRESWARS